MSVLRHFHLRRGELRHPDWGPATGAPRVLIENPDGADAWAHADLLREAGYDVAVCSGPSEARGRRRLRRSYFEDPAVPSDRRAVACPVLEGERCTLVDGADCVVSSSALPEGGRILTALGKLGRPALVVECAPGATVDDLTTSPAAIVAFPPTEGSVVQAVADALGTTP